MTTFPFIRCNYPSDFDFMNKVSSLLRTGPYTNNGPYVQLFEKGIERLTDSKIAVTSNGESALMLAIAALGLLNAGKFIVVPSYTFSGTVSAIYWTGNYPLYCDVKSVSYPLINTNHARDQVSLARDLPTTHKEIGAILGVDLYGLPCDYEELNELGKEFKVPVIIDSAQAFGTKVNNKWIGKNCDIHIFSFHTTKSFHTLEGGAVSSEDEYIIEEVKRLRAFGIDSANKPNCTSIGLNAKMNELQALIGLEKLSTIESVFYKKNLAFSYYINSLKKHNIQTLTIPKNSSPVMNKMPIFIKNRDEVCFLLRTEGIQCEKYWDIPVHRMTAFYKQINLPVTDKVSDRALCLPFYNDISFNEIDYIVEKVHGLIN